MDEAIKRGDDIALATIPERKEFYIDSQTGSLKGNYAKELQYLVQKNIQPTNLSHSKWLEVKGWFK